MVMNARKLTRLNDGYFDRNPTHPYQNSNKYSKQSYNERYGDKMRDSTSNGNMYGGSGRNESPDAGSRPAQRDRSYHNKASYSQRVKERERDKLEKDSNKSPMEKLKVTGGSGGGGGREHQQHYASHRNADAATTNCAEHRNSSNHDRTASSEIAIVKVVDKEKEKRLQVGDWSEHVSSSGKKYYYNCKTEVSQWEKPKEWMDWEKQQGKNSNDTNKSKDIGQDKTSDKHSNEHMSRSSLSHYNHPASRFRNDDRHHSKQQQQQSSSTSGSSSRGGGGGSSQQQQQQQQHGGDHFHHRNSHAHFKDEQQQSQRHGGDYGGIIADHHHRLLPRDLASRRDADRRAKSRKSSEDSQTQDMDISSDSTPSGSQGDSHSQTQTPVSYSNQHCSGSSQHTPPPAAGGGTGGGGGGSSLSNLPKLLSQFAGGANKSMQNADKQELSAHEALQTLQTALLLTRQVTMAQSNIPSRSPHSSCAQQQQPDASPFLMQRSPVPLSSHQSQLMALSHHSMSDHKLRAASAAAAAEDERDRGARSSPGSEYSHRSSSRGSPTSSVCSVQGQGMPSATTTTATGTTSLSAAAALRPAVPTLSPSLANYFRDDLIKHVMGWQADHAERQANKYSEEAHNLGSLTCTKVSAELKTSRSLVRVAEIQATLQEQRILFLRQQIKELEDWKSQNSFMNNS